MSLPSLLSGAFESQQFVETGPTWDQKIFYGGTATVLSAANSIYNTFATYGSWMGMDTKTEETADWVRNTIGDDGAAYYLENKSTIDTAGFLVGAVGIGIGTTAFIKAAQLGRYGGTLQRWTGLASTPRKELLETAAQEYNKGALAVSAQLNAAKQKAFMLGVGDNALQSLAVETTVLGLTNQAPLFEGWEVKDYAWNMATGVAFGTAVGAGVDWLRANSFFRDVQLTRAKEVRPWEPGGVLGKGSYTGGDEITSLINFLDELPAVHPGDFELAQSVTKKSTIKLQWEQAQAIANKMAGGNALLGKKLIDTLQNARVNGADKQQLTELLANAESLRGIDRADAVPVERFYFRPPAEGEDISLTGGWANLISKPNAPFPGQPAIPYAFTKGMQPKVAIVGVTEGVDTAKAGWNKGFDIVLGTGDKKMIYINPRSKAITRVPQPGESNLFSNTVERMRFKLGQLPAAVIQKDLRLAPVIMDLRTGELTENALATLGDLYSSGPAGSTTKLSLNKAETELYGGPGKVLAKYGDRNLWDGEILRVGQSGANDLPALFQFKTGGDYLVPSGRWTLAQLTKATAGETVSSADLPMFVRAIRTLAEKMEDSDPEKWWEFAKSLKFLNRYGDKELMLSRSGAMNTLLEEAGKSLDHYVDALTFAGRDLDEVQRILNIPKAALEEILQKGGADSSLLKRVFLEDPLDTTVPGYVKINYAIGNPVDEATGMMLRGTMAVQEKVKLQQEVNKDAFNWFAGDRGSWFTELTSSRVRDKADPSGVSAGFFKSFEGDYSLKGFAGYIGNQTEKLEAVWKKQLTEKLAFGGGNAILNNPAAGAEVSSFLHMFTRTGKQYELFTWEGKTGYIEGELYRVWQKLQREAAKTGDVVSLKDLEKTFYFKDLQKEGWSLTGEGLRPWRFIEDAEAETFLRTWQEVTGTVAEWVNTYRAAQGIGFRLNPKAGYTPPVNLRKFPHVVFIQSLQDTFGQPKGVGAITARTADEMAQKIARVDRTKFEVITKDAHKRYHEAQGNYDYNMMMNDPDVNSFLRREGALAEYYPTVSPQDVVAHLSDYIAKQTTLMTRNFVSLRYAQEMEELLALSSQHTELSLSAARRTTKAAEMAVKDPYLGYIRTMLNMSSMQDMPLWVTGQEKLNAFLAPAFNKVRQLFLQAANKTISFQEANDLAEKAGLGRVYEKVAEGLDMHKVFKESNGVAYDSQVVTKWIAAANNITVNLALRLDHAAGMINAVSAPILAIPEMRSVLKNIKDPKISGELGELLSYKVANSQHRLPTAGKLYMNAISRLSGNSEESKKLAQYYMDIGIVRPDIKDYYNLMDQMAVTGNETMSQLAKKTTEVVDFAAKKVFFSDFFEQRTRMIVADMMKQVTEVAGLDSKLAAAYINTFSSRVNGVFMASQRPLLFQGPVGMAIGLFQSYQFNLIQNVFRHMMNRDKMGTFMLFGLQSSLYGLQSLPAFQAINMHLIGNAPGNTEHRDAYSFVPSALGQEVGETLLYGGLGFLTDFALYTRGDINPRNITVVPLNPAEWPAVSAFGKFVDNMGNFFKNTAASGLDGEGLWQSFKFALEHNGINRPLTGLVQNLQGYSTTSKGGLIQGQLDMSHLATVSRLIGSKPLNEAIAMDAMYRIVSYRAADVEARSDLSRAIRLKLVAGVEPDSEDWDEFAARYAKTGGTIEGFNRFVDRIMKTYGTPVANIALDKMNTAYGRRMWEIMGGEGLDDLVDTAALDDVSAAQ